MGQKMKTTISCTKKEGIIAEKFLSEIDKFELHSRQTTLKRVREKVLVVSLRQQCPISLEHFAVRYTIKQHIGRPTWLIRK